MKARIGTHVPRFQHRKYRYRVTWLTAVGAHDFEDPLCYANFEGLRAAEHFERWLAAQTTAAVYGVEMVPL